MVYLYSKGGVTMITQHDKKHLTQLQTDQPQDFDFIIHLLENYRNDTRLGCHDVANIISLVYGNFQLLELTTPGLSENPRWLQMGDDLRYLVSAMESISYYRYSHIVKLETISLNDFINEKLLPLIKMPEYQLLHINTEPIAKDFSVNMDPTKIIFIIKAILDNIADNNCDTNVEMSFYCKYDALFITISDDSSIIETGVMSRMFEPFNSNKPNHIGLSLSSAYQIAMAHNGSIEIFPIGDKGHSYMLCLPL